MEVGTALDPEKIAEKLSGLSRRGKLPGYVPKSGGFLTLAYGWVYDFDLEGTFRRGASETAIAFRLSVKPKMPWIVALSLALSVFPGVWITDSMLSTYFDWYPREFWKTCAWYLPLSVLPIPWVWKTAMNRSRAEAEASAQELIERIATEVGGRIGAGGA